MCQIVSCQQWKDVGSRREVVPLVKPVVPQVDGSEAPYVLTSIWLNVVECGCYYSSQVKRKSLMCKFSFLSLVPQEVFVEC